jgi:hypothetical protein
MKKEYSRSAKSNQKKHNCQVYKVYLFVGFLTCWWGAGLALQFNNRLRHCIWPGRGRRCWGAACFSNLIYFIIGFMLWRSLFLNYSASPAPTNILKHNFIFSYNLKISYATAFGPEQ